MKLRFLPVPREELDAAATLSGRGQILWLLRAPGTTFRGKWDAVRVATNFLLIRSKFVVCEVRCYYRSTN